MQHHIRSNEDPVLTDMKLVGKGIKALLHISYHSPHSKDVSERLVPMDGTTLDSVYGGGLLLRTKGGDFSMRFKAHKERFHQFMALYTQWTTELPEVDPNYALEVVQRVAEETLGKQLEQFTGLLDVVTGSLRRADGALQEVHLISRKCAAVRAHVEDIASVFAPVEERRDG